MWLSRTFVPVVVVVVVVALAAGCGFRPLHGGGRPGAVDAATAELASIVVAPIADRAGQHLHNQLLDLLTPRGRPLRPRYTLSVSLSESVQRLAVRKSEFATRGNLQATAAFSLTDRSDGRTVLKGRSLAVTSFDVLSSEFGTLTAEKDARRRAVIEVATDVRNRIAVYFSNRRSPGRRRGE
jgi:LPS-assembly lipoprotein